MNMYFVYILISINNPEHTYVGVTQDLTKRLREHNSATKGYSKHHAPWRLETYIAFSNKKRAENFERYLKVGSGQAFLKKRLV